MSYSPEFLTASGIGRPVPFNRELEKIRLAIESLGSEGTFTPIFGDTGTNCTLASDTAASWSRRGNRVWLSGQIELTNINGATGSLGIKNAPFVCADIPGAVGGGVVTYATSLSLTTASQITIRANQNSSFLGFYTSGTTATAAIVPADITNTTTMMFTAAYVTSD